MWDLNEFFYVLLLVTQLNDESLKPYKNVSDVKQIFREATMRGNNTF